MSLIDEFIETELTKNAASTILQQIQTCHSAVEQLLINLEHLRTSPKLQLLNTKIQRVSAYLSTKEQILSLLQKGGDNPIQEWLINQQVDSPLLIELIRRQQTHLQGLIQQVVQRVFFSEQTMESYLEQNKMLEEYIFLLTSVRDDVSSNRSPGRDKLKVIDSKETVINNRVATFSRNISELKREIDNIVDQLYEFEKTVSQQFRKCIGSKKDRVLQQTPIFAQQIVAERGDKWREREEDYSKTVSQFGQKERKDQRQFRPGRTEGWGLRGANKEQPSQLGLSSRVQISNMRPETASSAFWKGPKPSLLRLKSSFQY